MSLKTLLGKIMPRASSGWQRSTGNLNVMALIEEGQDFLVNALGERRIFRGSDNQGWPPYLITTAGVYEYEIKAANLSTGSITLTLNGVTYTVTADIVKRIYIDVTSGGYDDSITWLGQPAFYSDINPYSSMNERLLVSEVSVESMPALGTSNPVVTFPFDPGDTTTKFFVDFYWRAPRLTSESIPLIVPPEFERALLEYAVGYIQEADNGSPSAFTEKFENFWKPEFVKKFRPAARMNNSKVILRPC